MAKVPAEVGSTANRYQILGKLAVGGMAEIFLARGANTTGLERYCVLKRILRERAGDAEFVQMFLDEARLAAQLQHPNIASVYDIGILGDSYFFTMEYVHGETVRSLIQRAQAVHRPVPLACALTVIAGAAAGLHHAHDRVANDGRPLGIVHRDVTPSNLMVSFEGNVKIVDFGVAKAADRAVETRSGTVKGKISYLSPEQCRGNRVDRRSDLFSLGIVTWELLTGARLYRRTSDFENMTAIVHEPPPPPSSRRAEVPRAVDDIVMRLLAKSVTDRFQTAGEVVEAIEDASMRARTILSTSAVSRLVRDLFGTRAEPWLELAGDTQSFKRVTLASRPLLGDPVPTPIDPMELELAGVPDLSVSCLLEHDDLSDSLGSSQISTMAPEPPQRPSQPPRGAGLAAGSIAPPFDQRAALPTAPMRVPALPGGVVSTRALLDAIANAVPVSSAPVSTLLGHSAPAVAAAFTAIRKTALPAAPANTVRDLAPPSFEEVARIVKAVTREPSSPVPVAPPVAPPFAPAPVSPWQGASAAPPPVPVPASHGAPVQAGSPPPHAQHATAVPQPAHRPRRARRFTPSLLAVVLIAAAIGAIAAWLSMRN